MSANEFTIGRERDADGNMLVVIDGRTHGTVESLKSVVDSEVEREILRKLRAAGVSLTLLDGQPQINVPAAAAGLVNIEGGQAMIEGAKVYDPRLDPHFKASVIAAVRDAEKHRAL